jgi:sugar phosphate isomerase/epimerase
LSDQDLLAAVRESNLFVAEISTVTRWLDGRPDEDEVLSFHLLKLFDARGVNCTALNAPFQGLDEAVAAFQSICDRAARLGGRCHIEFVPWVEPRNLTAAWEIVSRANRENGGLMLDTWHHYRSGGGPDDLRDVDAKRIFAIQLADAPARPRSPDPISLTFDRLLPGRGAADVAGCIRVLRQIGVELPYGGEVPSPDWQDRSAYDIAKAVYDSLTRVVAEAREQAG